MEELMMLRSAESLPFQPRLARAGRRGVRGLRSSWRTPEESADGGIPMYRLLVPVKEAGACLRDIEYLLKIHGWSKCTMEIHLLHVRLAVNQDIATRPAGSCGRQGSRALQEVRARVDRGWRVLRVPDGHWRRPGAGHCPLRA